MQRLLKREEKGLILALLLRAENVTLPRHWIDSVFVTEMDDGGMGSLRFDVAKNARMGRKAAELSFDDTDGVEVSAVLNLDQTGMPFELDIWKVNFQPLNQIPWTFPEMPAGKGVRD